MNVLTSIKISILKRKRRLRVLALLIGAWVLISPLIAVANAPPPPPMIWFDFQNGLGPIDAVQVGECESQQCIQPRLLAQSGNCTLPGCMALPADQPQSKRLTRLACNDKTCLMGGESYEAAWSSESQLQLRVRSGDRVWSSNTFTDSQQLEQAWLVSQIGSALQMDGIDPWEREEPPTLFWGTGFLVTLGVELLVLTLSLKFMGRAMDQGRRFWRRTYLSFGLMHCITYPLIWTLPFGLIPFQARIARFLGVGFLLVALVYLGVLFVLRKTESWKLILVSVLLLPCLYVGVMIAAFLAAYGTPSPFTTGISYSAALGMTEGLITVLEAAFLSILSRGMLSLRRAGVISLLMNVTSGLIGVLFWQFGLG